MTQAQRSATDPTLRSSLIGLPTHVVLPGGHPERAAAWDRLAEQLRQHGFAGDDPGERNGDAFWRYLCSTPCRQPDGGLGYVHVFRHPDHPLLGAPMTLGIAATPGWRPTADCTSLAPPRTPRKARLRLVG
jgi:hypothetical protein